MDVSIRGSRLLSSAPKPISLELITMPEMQQGWKTAIRSLGSGLLQRPAGIGGAVLVLLIVQTTGLALEQRRWWCECGRPFLWTSDAWSSHTSQHFADPYSLTHSLHGFLFCWALLWLWPRMSFGTGLIVATAIETVWELVENSSFVIDRYRTATAALGYIGDSIGNSLGDSIFCIAGFWLAWRIGWRWSAVLFVAVEAVLLITIRDSLLLNVVMLLTPLDAIREWQMGHS